MIMLGLVGSISSIAFTHWGNSKLTAIGLFQLTWQFFSPKQHSP